MFDANTFNLNYNNVSTYSVDNSSAAGYSYNSPSKSTAMSTQSSRSADSSYTSPDGKTNNPMYDLDNISMLSNNSFMSNSSNFSQNSNYTQYPM